MDQYTNLEQVLQDVTLAVMTEDIPTLKELNKVYLKYKAIPRIQKRFSDYYSRKFLGRDVPEMYDLVKEKRKAETGLFEDWQLPTDKYMVSEPDLSPWNRLRIVNECKAALFDLRVGTVMEQRAISREQFEKSLHDLMEKRKAANRNDQ